MFLSLTNIMGMWDACDSGILQFFYCLHVIYSWLYIEMQFANPLEPPPFTETALTQLKMIWEAVVRFSANTQRVLAGLALEPPFALPLNKALSSKSYLNFNRIRLIFVCSEIDFVWGLTQALSLANGKFVVDYTCCSSIIAHICWGHFSKGFLAPQL